MLHCHIPNHNTPRLTVTAYALPCAGSTVQTKHGNVNTDHMLFICSGAFHSAKPSDLMAELQVCAGLAHVRWSAFLSPLLAAHPAVWRQLLNCCMRLFSAQFCLHC